MSISSDIRAYADTAAARGKQVLDTAQAQLNDYTGQYADRATDIVNDLRHTAEKTINVDALTSAVEPYLAQLKEYTSVVTDKVEGVVATVRSDARVNALVERAEPVVGAVVDLAQERVVKPVQSRFGKPVSRPASRPAPKPTKSTSSASKSTTAKSTRKPAATKPASKSTTRSATKAAPRKAAAKSTTSTS